MDHDGPSALISMRGDLVQLAERWFGRGKPIQLWNSCLVNQGPTAWTVGPKDLYRIEGRVLWKSKEVPYTVYIRIPYT